MIVCMERQPLIARDCDERAEAIEFVVRSSHKASIVCIICSKSGHVASECFKLIGYLWVVVEKQKSGQNSTACGRGKGGQNPFADADAAATKSQLPFRWALNIKMFSWELKKWSLARGPSPSCNLNHSTLGQPNSSSPLGFNRYIQFSPAASQLSGSAFQHESQSPDWRSSQQWSPMGRIHTDHSALHLRKLYDFTKSVWYALLVIRF